MTRVEIISNRSVQADIEEALESALPGLLYTVIPVVHGRGRARRKLGTPTWPEENFVLIAYVSERDAETARSVVGIIKRRFPEEGIKVFEVPEAR
jgi:hypothetical protein